MDQPANTPPKESPVSDSSEQTTKAKAPKTNDERLKLLKSRLSVAKSFTKKAHDAWKVWVDEYNIDDWSDTEEIRDRVRIGYLFRKTESELPSIFDDQPDLFIKGRKPNIQIIVPLINGAYDFLWDVQHLDEVIDNAGVYFEVLGMGFVKSPWVTKTKQIPQTTQQPVIDAATGQPVIDPATGQPQTQPFEKMMDVPVIDNPMSYSPNPFKLYFSPETKFNVLLDYEHCPYLVEELGAKTVDEIEARYGVKVETTETLKIGDTDADNEISSDSAVLKDDMKRAMTYEYWGCLPKNLAPKGSDWAYDREYHIIFTTNDELLVEECPYDAKPYLALGNYGMADKFFRFGEAKHLMPLIQELQAYRTLILKHTRKSANAKPLVPDTANIDENAFRDPRGDRPVKFSGPTAPSYLQPPQLSPVVGEGIQEARTDLERTAGSFDLANGGGQSTVRTPKGISVYAEAADKNTQRKRKKVGRFIRELIMFQFGQLANNWKPEDGHTLSVLDQGETQDVQVTSEVLEVLRGSNILYNLDIETESLSLNKAQMRQDSLELLDRALATPPGILNINEFWKDALQNGFGKKDGDRFMVSPEQAQAAAQATPKPSVSMSIRVDAATPVGMMLLEKEGLLAPEDVQMAQAQNMAIAKAQAQQLPPGIEGGDANAPSQPQPGQALPTNPQGPFGQ